MRASASALLFAAAVLAAPAPDVFARGTADLDASVHDQGAGFYSAVFDSSTSVTDVVFTPMTDLAALPAEQHLDTRSTQALTKRDTTCSGAG
jgi:hypothetical protein